MRGLLSVRRLRLKGSNDTLPGAGKANTNNNRRFDSSAAAVREKKKQN